jgi:hypothetical protein
VNTPAAVELETVATLPSNPAGMVIDGALPMLTAKLPPATVFMDFQNGVEVAVMLAKLMPEIATLIWPDGL